VETPDSRPLTHAQPIKPAPTRSTQPRVKINGGSRLSLLLAWLIKTTLGFRATPEVEAAGIDEAEHAETAYEFSTLSSAAHSSPTVDAAARVSARLEREETSEVHQ
jgi:hypothetical protein